MTNAQLNVKPHVCDFCKKGFSKERTLINHLCEKKRRHLNKDEPYVRFGFQTWLRWHELTRTQHKTTYDAFMNSSLYLVFTRFGAHVIDTKMISPDRFIEFVITNSIKIDDWCKDTVYKAYVKYITRREDVDTVLERQVLLMERWAIKNGEEWSEYFTKIDPNTALAHIRSGRMSPWIVFNAVHVEDLLARMSDEQIMLLDQYVESAWWKRKMITAKADTKRIQEALQEYDI